MHNSFHLFDSFEIFKQHVTNPSFFSVEDFCTILFEDVKEIIQEKGCHPSIEEQVIYLYRLFLDYRLIIIEGLPKTGKSLIVSILQYAFAKLSKNTDLTNRDSSLLPIEVLDVYPGSYSYENLFGYIISKPNSLHVRKYGVFDAFCQKVSMKNFRLIKFLDLMVLLIKISEIFYLDISNHIIQLDFMFRH
jgi:hypothetical protein